ncbi:hypothetical protein [Pelagimonas varians]|uniref:hypothetical protein n=1 Tax=Pelagimonas varians TaxID=696760 RepID=UPI000DA14AC4|nr:hypothetical protein [Pelagimonas varians]
MSLGSDAASLQQVQVFSEAIGDYTPIGQVVDDFEQVFESGNLRRIDRALAITAQADNAPGSCQAICSTQ